MTSNTEKTHAKAGVQHYVLFLALVAVFSYGVYEYVIPRTVLGAVLALFSPHNERDAERFKEIQPMVFAVTTDKFEESKGYIPEGVNLKPYIKTDYIFDFTHMSRSEKVDGYQKSEGEWILKASGEGGIGESAIILEPALGFAVIAIVLGFSIAIFITFFFPETIGYMAQKVMREIGHTGSKIRLQTGFADETVSLLTMPDGELKNLEPHQVQTAFKVVWDRTSTDSEDSANAHGRRVLRFDEVFNDETDLVLFREEVLFLRIKEFFSDFVVKEIVDTRSAIEWSRNRLQFFKGLRLYMSHHFTEKYSNSTTGLAYGGAAILIVIIGIRGLKFIPATRPSLILAAISLEGAMLGLLAFVLMYTEEEERMDKMMKKMEDANNNQLETMKDVAVDMHSLSDALVGETSEIIKQKVEIAIQEALASDDNVKKIVSDKVAEKIILAMRNAFPERTQ